MKSTLPVFILCVLFATSGCARADVNKSASQQAKDTAAEAKADLQDAWARLKISLNDTWIKIKDYSYQEKGDFCKSLDQMSKDLDDQAARLRAKTSSASDTSSSSASDAREKAHREYEKARDNLKQGMTDLGNATADGWAAAKAKVSDEWRKLQEAWDNERKADSGS